MHRTGLALLGMGWVLALVLGVLLFVERPSSQIHQSTLPLKAANDSLRRVNAELENRERVLLQRQDSVLTQLSDRKIRIVELNQKRDVEMDRVLDMDHHELVRFFSNYAIPARTEIDTGPAGPGGGN